MAYCGQEWIKPVITPPANNLSGGMKIDKYIYIICFFKEKLLVQEWQAAVRQKDPIAISSSQLFVREASSGVN